MLKDRTDYLLDIDEVLGPKAAKKAPGIVKWFLKRRLHADEINSVIMTAEHYKGVGFFDEALKYLNITYRTRGEENIDLSKRYHCRFAVLYLLRYPAFLPDALYHSKPSIHIFPFSRSCRCPGNKWNFLPEGIPARSLYFPPEIPFPQGEEAIPPYGGQHRDFPEDIPLQQNFPDLFLLRNHSST